MLHPTACSDSRLQALHGSVEGDSLGPGPTWAAEAQLAPFLALEVVATGPWPAGWVGAQSRPSPQFADALSQVKGKFKHGGREALVDEVPGQAALGEGRQKSLDGLPSAGSPLAAGTSRGALGQNAGAALESSLGRPLPLTLGGKNMLGLALGTSHTNRPG